MHWVIEASNVVCRALRYLTVAAEDGDAISQFTLGFMYWSGRGTEPDIDKAYELFLKAAEQDVPDLIRLMICYPI